MRPMPWTALPFLPSPISESGTDLTQGSSLSLAMVANLARRHDVAVNESRRVLLSVHRKIHLFDLAVPEAIRFRESDSLTAVEPLTVLSDYGDPLGTDLGAPQSWSADAAGPRLHADRLSGSLHHHHWAATLATGDAVTRCRYPR